MNKVKKLIISLALAASLGAFGVTAASASKPGGTGCGVTTTTTPVLYGTGCR